MIQRYIMAAASAGAILIYALAVFASTVWSDWAGDVLIIGELHDNPHHHAQQRNALIEMRPKAVVFEMLTPDEAAQLADVDRTADAMTAATQGFHWSNIADYADVLAQSPVIVGAALSRADMRAAFSDGAARSFGPEAGRFGLTTPLPAAQQSARESLQFDAHCTAMPPEMMGGMVEAQRLRDAAFARAVIDALDTYGAPVVLITGNGHARTDWGVPVYLEAARTGLRVDSIGQGEAGRPPQGTFDRTLTDAPTPARDDPCAAFSPKG
ncbi:ChaN family lipoprotein [uncultured Tateyamaria sp.]|uniref:ChaN family lipoprotein n=1 Tax=Tateyamaria sp. 1078 TaxID=3417464 RepID=UPI0026321A4E|nr:ChaN family lipoprotein [uncultured Tateyamaria sp.]